MIETIFFWVGAVLAIYLLVGLIITWFVWGPMRDLIVEKLDAGELTEQELLAPWLLWLLCVGFWPCAFFTASEEDL